MLGASTGRAGVTVTLDNIRRETEANHRAFCGLIAKLSKTHPGQFALMKGCNVVGIFSVETEALEMGKREFADRLYSVHRIRPSSDAATQSDPVRLARR